MATSLEGSNKLTPDRLSIAKFLQKNANFAKICQSDVEIQAVLTYILNNF